MNKEINLFEEEVETVTTKDLKDPDLLDMLDKVQNREQAAQQEKQARQQVKGVIEAILFASSEPISFNKIREVTDHMHAFKPRILDELIKELQREYQEQRRAFVLEEMEQGYILRTGQEYNKYLDLLYRNKRMEKLSHASAEVLAIIAYKQPITRPQIEQIRGVDSSGTVQSLLERGLIEVTGRLEAPGRPSLLSITSEFLKYFGLKDIKDLPKPQSAPLDNHPSPTPHPSGESSASSQPPSLQNEDPEYLPTQDQPSPV